MKGTAEHIASSDEELAALVQSGDPAAFRELYSRYKKRIMAYCLRMMRSREPAEDVFQTVFANFFERNRQFNGPSFSAWLYGIARNCCLKALQKTKAEQADAEQYRMELSDLVEYPLDDDKSDWYARLIRAMEELSPEYREPIQLRYYDQLSYDEIAAVLEIHLSLVKVRIHRAKKILKELLEHSDQEYHESR